MASSSSDELQQKLARRRKWEESATETSIIDGNNRRTSVLAADPSVDSPRTRSTVRPPAPMSRPTSSPNANVMTTAVATTTTTTTTTTSSSGRRAPPPPPPPAAIVRGIPSMQQQPQAVASPPPVATRSGNSLRRHESGQTIGDIAQNGKALLLAGVDAIPATSSPPQVPPRSRGASNNNETSGKQPSSGEKEIKRNGTPPPPPPPPVPKRVVDPKPSLLPITVSSSRSNEETEDDAKIHTEDLKIGKYFKAVLEVVTSEFIYVYDLHLVDRVFIQPFIEKFGGLYRQIFSNWNDLRDEHERLLSRLCDLVPRPNVLSSQFPSAISSSSSTSNNRVSLTKLAGFSLVLNLDLMNKQMKRLAEVLDTCEQFYDNTLATRVQEEDERRKRNEFVERFAVDVSRCLEANCQILRSSVPYIVNYRAALQRLENLSGSNRNAEQFLKSIEEEQGGETLKSKKLRDFLIEPIQRPPRYPLLLKEVANRCLTSEGKIAVELALNSLKEVAKEVNSILQTAEDLNSAKLNEIVAMVKSEYRPELSGGDYSLLRFGEIKVIKSPRGGEYKDIENKPQVFGLLLWEKFVLLHLIPKRLGHTSRYHIKWTLDFTNPKLVDVFVTSEQQTMFRLLANIENSEEILWIFSAPNIGQCDGWISDFSKVKQHIYEKRKSIHVLSAR